MVHKKTFGSKRGPVCNTNRSQLSIWQKYDSIKLLISKGEGKKYIRSYYGEESNRRKPKPMTSAVFFPSKYAEVAHKQAMINQ
jgi:hypothetical protein